MAGTVANSVHCLSRAAGRRSRPRGAEKREACMEPFPEGAALEVRYPEPAIDLAALAACLSDAVPVPSLPPPPASEAGSGPTRGAAGERLLRWHPDTGVLTVDTPAVLSRLGRSAGLQGLKPTPSGG